MSIEKKSLISTLKTTKKANLASAPATNDGATSRKGIVKKASWNRKSAGRKAVISKM
jgi:hypothetical protein